jgi:hypothetical protein
MHPPEYQRTPATKLRMAFPTDIIGENTRGFEPGMATQITQRRKPFDWAFAEEVTSRPLNLRAPKYHPQEKASNKACGEELRRSS